MQRWFIPSFYIYLINSLAKKQNLFSFYVENTSSIFYYNNPNIACKDLSIKKGFEHTYNLISKI